MGYYKELSTKREEAQRIAHREWFAEAEQSAPRDERSARPSVHRDFVLSTERLRALAPGKRNTGMFSFCSHPLICAKKRLSAPLLEGTLREQLEQATILTLMWIAIGSMLYIGHLIYLNH